MPIVTHSPGQVTDGNHPSWFIPPYSSGYPKYLVWEKKQHPTNPSWGKYYWHDSDLLPTKGYYHLSVSKGTIQHYLLKKAISLDKAQEYGYHPGTGALFDIPQALLLQLGTYDQQFVGMGGQADVIWTDEEAIIKKMKNSPTPIVSGPNKKPWFFQKTLWIIRGAPGSGKSSLAMGLYSGLSQNTGQSPRTYEADQYWVLGDGTYKFIPEKLPEAHLWCQEQVKSAMHAGHLHVMVSNTFVTKLQMMPYRQMAREFGYGVQELICKGEFENVHGVPPETVRKMKQNFEF